MYLLICFPTQENRIWFTLTDSLGGHASIFSRVTPHHVTSSELYDHSLWTWVSQFVFELMAAHSLHDFSAPHFPQSIGNAEAAKP